MLGDTINHLTEEQTRQYRPRRTTTAKVPCVGTESKQKRSPEKKAQRVARSELSKGEREPVGERARLCVFARDADSLVDSTCVGKFVPCCFVQNPADVFTLKLLSLNKKRESFIRARFVIGKSW